MAAVVLLWAVCTAMQDKYWATDTALWTRVAAVDPGNPAAFDWLGAQAMASGRLDEAERLFRGSIAADAGSPNGACNLAILLHAKRGRIEQALPWYETSRQLAGRSLPCSLNHGVCLAESGRTEEAIALLLALADTPPHPPEAARFAAVLLMRQGQSARVGEVLSRALSRHPREPQLLAMLADVYRQQDRRDEALEMARRLQALDPASERAQRLLRDLAALPPKKADH